VVARLLDSLRRATHTHATLHTRLVRHLHHARFTVLHGYAVYRARSHTHFYVYTHTHGYVYRCCTRTGWLRFAVYAVWVGYTGLHTHTHTHTRLHCTFTFTRLHTLLFYVWFTFWFHVYYTVGSLVVWLVGLRSTGLGYSCTFVYVTFPLVYVIHTRLRWLVVRYAFTHTHLRGSGWRLHTHTTHVPPHVGYVYILPTHCVPHTHTHTRFCPTRFTVCDWFIPRCSYGFGLVGYTHTGYTFTVLRLPCLRVTCALPRLPVALYARLLTVHRCGFAYRPARTHELLLIYIFARFSSFTVPTLPARFVGWLVVDLVVWFAFTHVALVGFTVWLYTFGSTHYVWLQFGLVVAFVCLQFGWLFCGCYGYITFVRLDFVRLRLVGWFGLVRLRLVTFGYVCVGLRVLYVWLLRYVCYVWVVSELLLTLRFPLLLVPVRCCCWLIVNCCCLLLLLLLLLFVVIVVGCCWLRCLLLVVCCVGCCCCCCCCCYVALFWADVVVVIYTFVWFGRSGCRRFRLVC